MPSRFTSIPARFGLVLAVALATAGVAAASASASLPEMEYTLPNTFVFSGGETSLEVTGSSAPVHCASATGSGEMKNEKEFTSFLKLKECTTKLAGFTVKCSSAGAATGEVVTKTMATRLVYLAKATHEAGFVFDYLGKNATIATFKCVSVELTARGELVSKVTPVNTKTTTVTVGLKGAKGVQEYTQYEGSAGEKLTASPFEEVVNGKVETASANATGLAITFAGAVLIRA
jgi:hypothetical protein